MKKGLSYYEAGQIVGLHYKTMFMMAKSHRYPYKNYWFDEVSGKWFLASDFKALCLERNQSGT